MPASLWEPFLAFLIVLNNFWEVFGCSIVIDFMSIKFGFSIVFGCWVNIFDCFAGFVFLSFKNDLALLGPGIFY